MLTVDGWASLAKSKTVRERINSDAYSKVYPSLVRYWQKAGDLDWDAALALLHMCYGWMPTIPNLDDIGEWSVESQMELAALLQRARAGNDLDVTGLELLKSFCNNSMNGGSKLLHWLRPDRFAIWDKRVALVFLVKSKLWHYQYNTIAAWQAYNQTVRQWSCEEVVQQIAGHLRRDFHCLSGVQTTRLIELVMFHGALADAD